jgi:hypothetical protein
MNISRPPKHKIYQAGIADREDKFIWQGIVVAENLKHGFKYLSRYKKATKRKGLCVVVSVSDEIVDRPKGVYEL